MEVWAVVLISSVVAGITGMSLVALRPFQKRSPEPIIIDKPREEVFEKFFAFISKGQLDFLDWTVKEKQLGRYLIAELEYCEEFRNKSIRCDAVINFDFSTVEENKTRIRWSSEYKHWCDAETSRRMQEHIWGWIEVIFTEPITAPIDEERFEVCAPTPLPAVETVPLVLECQSKSRRPRNITFERLHARILDNARSSHNWKIVLVAAAAPDLMSCDFHASDSIGAALDVVARLEIKFTDTERKQTTVDWTYIPKEALIFKNYVHLKDRADDWIRLSLEA